MALVEGQGTVTTTLYCCGCETDVTPRLTDGREVYPGRDELYAWVSAGLGYEYHTAGIRSAAEAGRVLDVVRQIARSVEGRGLT